MKIKKILVSQPKPAGDKSPYYDIAKKHNVEMVFRPFIRTEGLTAKEFRHSKVNLAEYTGVIFTSRAAVDNFFRLCEEMRVKVPDSMRYFCTTEAIALYLQKYIVYRKRKISFGATGKLDDAAMLASLDKNRNEKLLFPVSDVHKEDMSTLNAHGLDVTKVVMFRTVSNDFQPGEKLDYDMLLFFSPAGIDSLKKNFPDFKQDKEHIYLGAFGPTAVKAIEDADLRVDLAAPTDTHKSMPAALDAFLTEMEEKEKKERKEKGEKKG
ncbi:MAG: uroporphyrinogen-III synthase [Candidatus Amulumruptor caecigallinarius]|nr:uroporphyrinogen-III synthase [Candidatus Amulumruptor caecigallinarius]